MNVMSPMASDATCRFRSVGLDAKLDTSHQRAPGIVSASFSYNAATGREKIEFTLRDRAAQFSVYRRAVMGALAALQAACKYSMVAAAAAS